MADLLERLMAALADRYTIDHEIGRGGMATVYLAMQGFESDPWEHQVLYDVFEHHVDASAL